jgi:hypothetical protein
VREVKNIVTAVFVILSVMLCSVAYAGNGALPGIYHILFLAPKTMDGPSVSGTTDTATTLSATINKNGTGYYLTRLATAVEPTVAEVLAGPSFFMNAVMPTTQGITGLTASTAYKLYFVAKSSSNKAQSTVQKTSFTTRIDGAKLDAKGVPLANQDGDYVTTPWACIQDNVTGLVWEVKTADGGLHDQNDSYYWYNTTSTTNGGMNGYENSGATCKGYISDNAATYCNTQAYVARVNAAGWCGKSDWRMPTRTELLSLVSFDRISPTIDTEYFPNTPLNSVVWSSSPFAFYSNYAWYVSFGGGVSGNINRNYPNMKVRLVRDRQ